jgi:hypothetical protein
MTDVATATTPVTEQPAATDAAPDAAATNTTMPDASIKAANDALSHSLESANIVLDETNTVEGSKVGQDGNKTVFHDQNEFNVKVSSFSSGSPLSRLVWTSSPK